MTHLILSFPQWDADLLVYLNSKNADWLDPLMVLVSNHWFWAFICFCIVALMLYKRRRDAYPAIIFLLIGMGVTNGLNNVLKLIFARPRPCVALDGTINVLEDCGRAYSFFSAHSSTSFFLAVFALLYFRNKYFSVIVLVWASVVAYSRLYVGKHYPLDVIVGTVFGIILAYMTFWSYRKYIASKQNTDDLEDE
ncbi:phosphatase PAP2 family protein [Dysgonomonas sp. 520]|uniref:phosphatase PAP2 family protein n=1 Tax=Dysgonomonas sp. 520 TaxID=2302931 RepID=UPI0013D1D61B|nr:phosphatase PAP2 family protein [Dysgonomonas sp. 520]NDW09521.1 phosphatase PAP2 family protein [Dysgonomonas sp. 520]